MVEPLPAVASSSSEEQEETSFSLDIILTVLRRYWYAVIITALLGACTAYYLAGRQNYVYQKTASVMMRDSKAGKDASSERIMTELGIDSGSANLANESYVLKSTALMKKVVEDLDLHISYGVRKDFRELDLYRDTPLLVVFQAIDKSRPYSFGITPREDEQFTLTYSSTDDTPTEVTGSYGQPLVLPFATLTVHPTSRMNDSWKDREVLVHYTSPLATTHSLLAGLTVTRPDAKDSSLLEMTLTAGNPDKATDVLNHLIEVYNQLSKDEKSQSSRKVESFIDKSLKEVKASLEAVDQKITDSKIKGDIVRDTETTMTADFTTSQALEKEIFDLETQIKLASNLASSLKETGMKDALISVDTGLADSSIASQVTLYNEAYLEYQKIAGSAGRRNPIAVGLRDKMNSTRAAAGKALANYRNNLEIKHRELQKKQASLSDRLAATAAKEHELMPLMWEHKVKEEIYLMLLSKQLENALALAAAEPSARVLETAHGSDLPISPKTMQFVAAGGLGGAALCIFAFVGVSMLNNKVRNKHDLPGVSNLPVLAELPVLSKKESKHPSLFIQDDHSVIAECFHILRNNVDSLLPRPEQGGYIMMVTSTMAGEGKTMTSCNLASAFAKAGKKVLLIDGDLRKTSLSNKLGGKGRKGLTSILRKQVEDPASVIHTAENAPDGLFVLYAGPYVPNPVTLLSTPLLGKLLKYLQKQYDAVIIDCPPYGILADTAIIGALADISLYVVRSGMIDKRYFTQVQQLADKGKLHNLSYVINEVDFKSASYNYYGYGYGYQYGYGRKESEDAEKAHES